MPEEKPKEHDEVAAIEKKILQSDPGSLNIEQIGNQIVQLVLFKSVLQMFNGRKRKSTMKGVFALLLAITLLQKLRSVASVGVDGVVE